MILMSTRLVIFSAILVHLLLSFTSSFLGEWSIPIAVFGMVLVWCSEDTILRLARSGLLTSCMSNWTGADFI